MQSEQQDLEKTPTGGEGLLRWRFPGDRLCKTFCFHEGNLALFAQVWWCGSQEKRDWTRFKPCSQKKACCEEEEGVFRSFQNHQVFIYVPYPTPCTNSIWSAHGLFLGTQEVNLIQILCFSPTLWQRKCFLTLKCDKNKFQSPPLCALSVPWSYKKLMANISVGDVLKILAAHYWLIA